MTKQNTYQPKHARPKLQTTIDALGGAIVDIHPMCKSVPWILPRDFDNLVDSIMEHGLLTPILVDTNRMLLDGRSRLMACMVAGFEMDESHITITDAKAEGIVQTNIARRHLTIDQKIMQAAERLNAMRAKNDQRKQIVQSNQRCSTKNDAKSVTKPKRKPRAIEQVAKEEKVPREKLAQANKLRKVSPELADKVRKGELPLSDAAQSAGISKKPSKPKKNQKPARANDSNKSATQTNKPSSNSRPQWIKVHSDKNGGHTISLHDTRIVCRQDVPQAILVHQSGEVWRMIGSEDTPSIETFDSCAEALAAAQQKLLTLASNPNSSP